MQLLKVAKRFLEEALKTEDGKKAVNDANIHCREQLLVARVMANEWTAKSPSDWQSVINQCNNEYPEWSPLVDAKYASGYAVPEGGGGNLAVVWMKRGSYYPLIPAEDQFVSLHEAAAHGKKVKVHRLVKIAYSMYRANVAVAVATPVPSIGIGTAEQEAKIAQLERDNQELRKQLSDAKDDHINDMKNNVDLQKGLQKVFSPGAVTGAGVELGLELLKSKNEQSKKKDAGTSCHVAFHCTPLQQIISLTVCP